jgi:Protein of unknown function (DUF1640)
MDRYRRLFAVLQPLAHAPPFENSLLLPSSALPVVSLTGRRNFATSQPARTANFDTLKVVQRLEAQGFTPAQSKAVMELLKDVIDESVLGLTRTMVTREEQDKVGLELDIANDRLSTSRKSTSHN